MTGGHIFFPEMVHGCEKGTVSPMTPQTPLEVRVKRNGKGLDPMSRSSPRGP